MKGDSLTKELILEFSDNDLVPLLFGEYNDHLSYLEKKLSITISDRGNVLRIKGRKDNIAQAQVVLQSLYTRLKHKELEHISHADIDTELRFLKSGVAPQKTKSAPQHDSGKDKNKALIKTKNKTITARSPNQAEYLNLIKKKDLVFGLGPAGTGKTYLAVAAGVDLYLRGEVERLVFTRPAVEAGEKLGFLPGDMKDKVDPFLRPIFDALQDMIPQDILQKKTELGEIEIAPIAFMRGRTLAHSYVILDEAQNTTCAQMKMFLTRMGEASRMVITGDASQSDLPPGIKSGLVDALETLGGIDDIGQVTFKSEDVIRHPLVRKIIDAYEKKNKAH